MRTHRLVTSSTIKDIGEYSVSPSQLAPEKLLLASSDLHHLIHVLRANIGDQVELVERSTGRVALLELVELQGNTPHFKLVKLTERVSQRSKLSLVVSTLKPSLCDFLVEKCTELGVHRVVFFEAERAQRGRANERVDRLKRISDSAIKQSGAREGLEIELAANLVDAVRNRRAASDNLAGVILVEPGAASSVGTKEKEHGTSLSEEIQPLIAVLTDLLKAKTRLEPDEVYADLLLVVGPEGGFTAEELSCALELGLVPASLGGRTLRAETAAVVACGIALQILAATTTGSLDRSIDEMSQM